LSAIEYGNGEEVEYGEVDGDHAEEHKEFHKPFFGNSRTDLHDAYGSFEIFCSHGSARYAVNGEICHCQHLFCFIKPQGDGLHGVRGTKGCHEWCKETGLERPLQGMQSFHLILG